MENASFVCVVFLLHMTQIMEWVFDLVMGLRFGYVLLEMV